MRISNIRKGDLYIIAICIILIIVFYLISNTTDSSDELIAIIKIDNDIVREIDLGKVNEPYTIDLDVGFFEQILVEKGRIRFLKSDCPNKICVKTGWLDKPGDIAVCIPAKAIIKIEGFTYDAIVK